MEVFFQQDTSQVFFEIDRFEWSTLGPGSDGGGMDVALITLDRAVPTSLVEKIPRVNVEDVGGFLRRNRKSPYMIAGYGPKSDSQRKYGGVNKVTAMMLECGAFSIREITCLPHPELWLSYYGGQAIGVGGDSGGPLFGKDKDTGEYVLIGVRSGHRWWKSDLAFEENKQVYAPIGKLGKGGVQVAEKIGDDVDRDGVPDHLDNCAPAFCEKHSLPMSRCINSNQEDDDGDGVGESCDNCPQWRCDLFGDGRSCGNIWQKDSDGDGIGDICDRCPLVGGPTLPAGKIGQACGCPGRTDLEFLKCKPNDTDDPAFCEKMRAGSCLYDKDLYGNFVGGLCSQLPDSDGDGLPDECDTCMTEPDPDNRNSNSHIEIEVGADVLGDVCDPVPIFPFSRPEAPQYGRFFIPISGSDSEGVDYEKLDGFAWLGVDSTRQYTSFEQPLVFRHCSCYGRGGVELDEEECAREQCRPSLTEEAEVWKSATVVESATGDRIGEEGLATYFETYRRNADMDADPTIEVPWPSSREFVWRTFEDLVRAEDPIDGELEGYGLLQHYRTHGLLASVVLRRDGHAGSLRDQQPVALRTSVKLTPTPRYSREHFEYRAFDAKCVVQLCFGWLDRVSERINPDPNELLRRGPVEFVDKAAARLNVRGSIADVTRRLSPTVLELMSSGSWAWVPMIDDPVRAARNGLDRVGVLVPREGSRWLSPLVLVQRNGEVMVSGELEEGTSVDELVGAVQLSAAEKAVYHAIEDRLYIVGSAHGWRTVGVTSDTLRTGGFDHSPGDTILGLTYDSLHGRMLTLEVIQASETDRVATIFAHDPFSGTSNALLSVPYTGDYSGVSLAADRTGALVVMGSVGEEFRAWRFTLAGNELDLKGSFEAQGILMDEPLHSTVTVPLLYKGQARLLDLDASLFTGGMSFKSL